MTDEEKADLVWRLATNEELFNDWMKAQKVDETSVCGYHAANAYHSMWYMMRKPMNFVKSNKIQRLIYMCKAGPTKADLVLFCALIPMYKNFLKKYPNVEQARLKYKKEGSFFTAKVMYIGRDKSRLLFQDEDSIVLHAKVNHLVKFKYEAGQEFVLTGQISFRGVTSISQPVVVKNAELRIDGVLWEADIEAKKKLISKRTAEQLQADRYKRIQQRENDPNNFTAETRMKVEHAKFRIAEISKQFPPKVTDPILKQQKALHQQVVSLLLPDIRAYVSPSKKKNEKYSFTMAESVIRVVLELYRQFQTPTGRLNALKKSSMGVRAGLKKDYQIAKDFIIQNPIVLGEAFYQKGFKHYIKAVKLADEANYEINTYKKCKQYLLSKLPKEYKACEWIY